MNQSITVIFDGKVLHPEKPLTLTPNQKYKIIIESETELSNNQDGWDIIESLIGTVEAPEDWAIEHDHYLYGLPKKYNK
jgi:hypothetical protein